MKNIIILILFVVFNVTGLICQTSFERIVRIKDELFPSDTTTILLYKIDLSDEYGRKIDYEFRIDSTKRIRKEQPELDVVGDELRCIAMAKDTTVINELRKIYNLQLDFFYEEWKDFYLQIDQYNRPGILIDQYAILGAFEMVLKSLELNRSVRNSEELFELILEGYRPFLDIKNAYKIKGKSGELMKSFFENYRFQNIRFKNLINSNSLYYGRVGFSYLDPFMDELKPYFIKELANCNFDSCDSNDLSCSFIISKIHIYNSYDEPEIEDFYIRVYDNLLSCDKIYLAFRYAMLNKSERLTRFLISRYIDHYDDYFKSADFDYLRIFLRRDDGFRKEIVITELVNRYSEIPEPVIGILKKLKTEEIEEYFDKFPSSNSSKILELVNKKQ